MNPHRVVIIVACFFFILSVGYGQELNVSKIDSSLLVGSNAVMRKDQTITEVKVDRYKLKRDYTITLLNKSAASFCDISIGYKEKSSKITKFDVSLYNASGDFVGSVGKKELRDYAGYDGFSIITDYRYKHIKVTRTDFPFTIAVSYEIESKNTFTLPSWAPAPRAKLAIENSSFEVVNESNSEMRTNEHLLDEFGVKKIGKLKYECNNLQAFANEAYSPHIKECIPWVEIKPAQFSFEKVDGYINDWESYGSFFYSKLIDGQNNMKAEQVLDDLKEHVDPTASKKEIIFQVYKYVQDNTRYISIALDQGGFQPMSTSDVHENKYGDCKALSFYMVSLLNQYDIKANYVEVYAGVYGRRSLNRSFASPAPGNHIIVNVPLEKDTIWLDCTSTTNPFNYLGKFTDDRYAVEINKQGGKIVKTPSYDEISFVEEKGKGILDAEGNLSLDLELTSSGYYIDKVKYSDFDQEKMKEVFEERRYKHLHNPKLISYDQISDDDHLMIKEQVKITSDDYAELVGSYFMVPINISRSYLPRIKSKKDRKFPIDFERKILEKRAYEFQVPSGYVFEDKMKSDKIESKYGRYEFNVEQTEEGSLLFDSELEIYKGQYSPSEIKDIKSFLASVKIQQDVQIVLKQN